MTQSDSGTRQVAVAGWLQHAERRRRGRTRLPALTLLAHPDPARAGERTVLAPLAAGKEVLLSRTQPGFALPGETAFRALEDPWISRTPLRLSPREAGGVRLVVGESPLQVIADGVPVTGSCEIPGSEIERGVVLELAGRVALLLHSVVEGEGASLETPHFDLVGESDGIARVRREIAQVADLDVPVLLRGETGTGKELVAQALHRASRRRAAAFLSVNLAAVPASLAASELFGAARGAYTGAVSGHTGYFERAQGGTFFLDEIGDAPVEVQVSLLRALESGEIQRVGSAVTTRVDVRLIAGTDADLERAIADGRFRPALFHRLAGYEIALPPLRERRDDFGLLLFHFLRQELQEIGEERRLLAPEPGGQPWMPASLVARLARCDWPGNVRQLRNVARQLAIESRGASVVRVGPQVEKLLREPPSISPISPITPPIPAASPVAAPAPLPPLPPITARPRNPAAAYRSPAEVSEAELLDALRACRWEVKPAAVRLGISRPSLYLLIERCPGLRKASDLGRTEILECRARCGGDLGAVAAELEVSRSGLLQRMRRLGID
ncbi:MAG TPA: sigma 54-interacting transcriptional regulator [Thermoanaerobaculia bacterium]|nr:sigma 54-interacting transcriptional regulator [Thermoanaerobaculia bacterium]